MEGEMRAFNCDGDSGSGGVDVVVHPFHFSSPYLRFLFLCKGLHQRCDDRMNFHGLLRFYDEFGVVIDNIEAMGSEALFAAGG